MKLLSSIALAAVMLLLDGQVASARGFGGAHFGGGVHYGGFGGYGYHYGGFREGGYHYGGIAPYGGYRAGGVQYGAVRGPRGFEAAGVRAGGVVAPHAHLPTDFGVGHISAVSAGYAGAIGHRTAFFSNNALAARGLSVRNNFYYHYGLFRPGWYARYPYAWRPGSWYAAGLWTGLAWGGLVGWFGWPDVVQPVYYDYGNTIVYQGDTVYINNQPGPSAEEYYQQAQTLAESRPDADKKTDEYDPLGIFALVQGEQSDASEVFQLAVNKAGIMRGNYQNILTQTVLPVRGAVNEKTQRAAWTVGDNKEVVYDSGIYNLTKDEAPILIHFGKDRTQQWLLVRLKDAQLKDPTKEPAKDGAKPVTLIVRVPANAEVFLNGSVTKATGTVREYVSPPLETGWKYSYEIRGRWTENGQPVERTRVLRVQPGQRLDIDLTKKE